VNVMRETTNRTGTSQRMRRTTKPAMYSTLRQNLRQVRKGTPVVG
jgi:hypothetical protein